MYMGLLWHHWMESVSQACDSCDITVLHGIVTMVSKQSHVGYVGVSFTYTIIVPLFPMILYWLYTYPRISIHQCTVSLSWYYTTWITLIYTGNYYQITTLTQ